MYKPLTSIALITLLSGCIVHIGGSHNQADTHLEKTLTLDANQLTTLVADTGAGSLKIIGSTSTDQITVKADIFTNDDLEYKLSLSEQGTEAKLIADYDIQNGLSFNINQGFSIDLVVTMPSHLALDLEDSSGDIAISGLTSSIEVDDSSGSITIDGGSSVVVDDSSGDLYISNISGDTLVEDGSGYTRIENTQGAVEVDDSSGDIVIKNVKGVVKVDDGSGSITVNGAGGLIIEDDGSGEVNIDNVKGEVKIDS